MAKFFGMLRRLGPAERAARGGSGVFAAAPRQPRELGDASILNPIPPFGTNYPVNRPVTIQEDALDGLSIPTDPRGDWYLALPQKLKPNQVGMIMRSALGGDIWQFYQLCSLMLDTWPMLRKCQHELREPVSTARYLVRPFAEEGEEPTASAKERAALVRRAMKAFRPDPFAMERGFSGMVYDLTDAMLTGLSIVELVWRKAPKAGRSGQWEWLPKASSWVHPRHFTFTNDGRIALFGRDWNKMYWPQVDDGMARGPDPRKFLCAQHQNKTGSPLGQGQIRPLCYWWSAVVYCREWMLTAAERFGSPFRWVNHKAGMGQPELREIDNMLAKAGQNGWARLLEGVVLNTEKAGTTGTDNAQRYLMEYADMQCMQLLLGQNLTSQSPRMGGSKGQGEVHADVKRERVEGLSAWAAADAVTQFARAVCLANYEDDDECPEVVADFTEPADPMAQAQRDTALLTAGVPMLFEDFCKANNLAMPQAGDITIKDGVVGVYADPQDNIVGDKPPVQAGLDADGNPVPPAEARGGEKVVARARGRDLAGIISRAAGKDVEELRELVARAAAARHVNGEFAAVESKLRAMSVPRNEERFSIA